MLFSTFYASKGQVGGGQVPAPRCTAAVSLRAAWFAASPGALGLGELFGLQWLSFPRETFLNVLVNISNIIKSGIFCSWFPQKVQLFFSVKSSYKF